MTMPLTVDATQRSPWAGLAALRDTAPCPLIAANGDAARATEQAPAARDTTSQSVLSTESAEDGLWAAVAAQQDSDARIDAIFAGIDNGTGTRPARKAGSFTIANPDALGDFLSIQAWADRELPAPERLLGELVTRDTRMFIVGATGLGKTMLGLALAHGIATGAGFLHWRSARPARVLYLDGEMASALIKLRSVDAMRRSDMQPAPGMLSIYCRDFEGQIEERFPGIGTMPALNTPAGHRFVFSLLEAIGGADAIFFDNLMSLTEGDQKDETTWSGVLPLIDALSAKRVGQVWFDHTGHDRTRQYGASAKAWRMDAVGVMTPIAEGSRGPAELAFALSFDAPHGKARRRTPDNWRDFAPCTLRLAGDHWSSEMRHAPRAGPSASLSPSARTWHTALLQALASTETLGHVTREAWRAQAEALGLISADCADDAPAEIAKRSSKFRKYVSELRAAGWISDDGRTIRDLCGAAT